MLLHLFFQQKTVLTVITRVVNYFRSHAWNLFWFICIECDCYIILLPMSRQGLVSHVVSLKFDTIVWSVTENMKQLWTWCCFHGTAVDKDCKNLNSCCKLELENIFISCFNNSSLHYWVTFEKNIFFSHPLVLSERKFLLSHENSTKSTAVSCFLSNCYYWNRK